MTSPEEFFAGHPGALRVYDAAWMHHLEVRDVSDIDDEVSGWLSDPYRGAG
jgi:hypothetical protein